MLTLSKEYNKSVQEESKLTAEELKTRHVEPTAFILVFPFFMRQFKSEYNAA